VSARAWYPVVALVALLGAVVLLGCILKAGVAYPVDYQRFEAPPEYADYWKQLESCAGLKGDPSRIVWFRARAILLGRCSNCIAGFWDAHDSVTYIYIVVPHKDAPPPRWAVQHEMLHELLWQNGVTDRMGRIPGMRRGHPRPPFGKCAA